MSWLAGGTPPTSAIGRFAIGLPERKNNIWIIIEAGAMEHKKNTDYPAENKKTTWVKYMLIALIFEKIIQHIFVTLAFYFNWAGIESTVAPSPRILMILGGFVAVLFVLSLRGIPSLVVTPNRIDDALGIFAVALDQVMG